MAIKDRILNFIKTNKNFTPSQIAETLNLNKNTVRGRLSELRKEFVISKRKITYEKKRTKKEVKILKEEKREIEEPEEVEEKIWIRKIVKLTAYSKGRKDDLFSGTWALWDERVYETLRDKIIKKYNRTHGIDGFSIDKDSSFGLDEQGESTTDPPFKFPNTEEWID